MNMTVKFIYDVVDDVMMSDISKWWLVIMQHSSLSFAVICIDYRANNRIIEVLIKCKNNNVYVHCVQSTMV